MQKKSLVENDSIAVIIPAYKDRFLEKTLFSLASQTNKKFTVYVGDDHSPNDLEVICEKFNSILDIHYTRFDSNIGGENIIDQWKRCINLSSDEKWIWLFSDDDIADSNCVDAFYNLLEKLGRGNKVEVYRFNTRVIDDNGVFRGKSEDSPFYDTSLSMAYHILHGKRGNSMPDHIFSRKLYEKYGILETDFAQAADWGTSIQFALDNGIYTIPDALVSWRLGDFNISGQVKFFPKRALRGHLQFLNWILDFSKKNILSDGQFKYIDIQYATEANLLLVIKNHYKKLSLKSFFDIYTYYTKKESNVFKASIKTFRLYFFCRKILIL